MIEVFIASAFSKNGSGGNLAGVVPNRPDLTAAQKQEIARVLGCSETAFVTKASETEYFVEYFTPVEQVALCGHATIAAFTVLRLLGQLGSQRCTIQTGAGRLQICAADDGQIMMEQNRPVYGPLLQPQQLQSCMGSAAFSETLPIQVVSTGLRDIILPMGSVRALSALQPDMDRLARFNSSTDTVGVHAFAPAEQGEADAVCRDFAPLYGIPEESATGTASCALACYLFRYGTKKETYLFEQGYELGAPSQIVVRLQSVGSEIERVWVGGSGYLVRSVQLSV